MKNIVFTILILQLVSINVFNAQDYFNSAEFKEIDTEKKNIETSNSESILEFIQEWEEKAMISNDSMAMAYVWMTGIQMLRGSNLFDKAKEYGEKAQGIITRHSLKGAFTHNKRYLASVILNLGNFEEGIQLALQSIDEFNLQDPYVNQFNYHVLADTYLTLRNYERMDHYLQKWYALVREKNIRMDLGFAIYNMQELYDLAGMYEQASLYQDEFYKFYAESGKELSQIPEHAFITITGDGPEETITKLLNYLPYHVENKRDHLVSRTNRQIGKLYLEVNNPDQAIIHFKKSVEKSEREILENQLDGLAGLADAYGQVGDFENAFITSKEFVILRDSFHDEQVLIQSNALAAKYENEKKELQLEIKEGQIQSKNRWLIFSLIAGIIVLALAGFIFYLNRKLRTNNVTLSKTLGEKETLLQEIHHRVKNNLQVISSLLSLQSKYVKDKTAVSALNEGQNRVESMALIHQNLYREDNITGVNMKSYVPLLASNIFNSYNIQGDRVKIEFDIDDITLDVATVIPIGLVLNELISNSLKYAFPEDTTGLLKVTFKEKDNALLLMVKDDGIGLKDQEAESGFGTKLINSFTRKLEGELKITSNNGTNVELLIKNFNRA